MIMYALLYRKDRYGSKIRLKNDLSDINQSLFKVRYTVIIISGQSSTYAAKTRSVSLIAEYNLSDLGFLFAPI